MTLQEIRERLLSMQDQKYRDFQVKLIPSVPPETVTGVRTPDLRKLAKELQADGSADLLIQTLPHDCFEENQLHAFILSDMKDYGTCLDAVTRFLPYVDNWATCDQMSPKVFRKHAPELLGSVKTWLASGETYTVRFAIRMLMDHFLDDRFDPAYPEMVASVRSEEYYVRMMAAWYFATALAKQYDAVLPYLENHRLDQWTHQKAIQKAVESFRIRPEQKEYLKNLRITGGES